MIQDFGGTFFAAFGRTESLPANLAASGLAVCGWGFFLYQGVMDPLGGINTLWPLFGIANQMLAAIALTLCTVILFKLKRGRVAWVTGAPTAWLAVCTLTAGAEKMFSSVPAIGFLAHAAKYGAAAAHGQVLAPAKTIADMRQVVINDYVDVSLTALFMTVVSVMLVVGAAAAWRAASDPLVTAAEVSDDMRVLA